MATNQSADLFELVPEEWFELVVGSWVVVLAIAGIVLTLEAAGTLLAPLGSSAVGAVFATTVAAAAAYGSFGYGATYGYLAHRGLEPGFVVDPFDRAAWRWVGGLGLLFGVLAVLGGVWTTLVGRSFEVVSPHFAIGSPITEGLGQLSLGITGVNEIVTQAPVVALVAVLGGVLMGPAVGGLFHGVLQNMLARIASRRVALAGTALATTLTVRGFAFHSITSSRGFVAALVTFVFVLGVAYAYRQTENLLVPMAAYGLSTAFTLVLGWMALVASLYAHYGHL